MNSALEKLAKRSAVGPVVVGREVDIPLDKIRFDSTQPRKAFHHLDGRVSEKDDAYITELAQSIEGSGLIQAITVQDVGDGTYLVVVGECRTRAHLLLKRATIRAVVRNDLTDSSTRLLYQLAENIVRQDLTDDELAGSIRGLMKGTDDVAAMSQVAIAKILGKSESWVSRFVRFGDEELQRVWVAPGIVVTPENLYRVSILPEPMKMDILRRVGLSRSDPEFLEKPVSWAVINQMSKQAKTDKVASKGTAEKKATNIPRESAVPDPGTSVAGDGGMVAPESRSGADNAPDNGVSTHDDVGQAFAAAAADGQQPSVSVNTEMPNSPVTHPRAETEGYQLPADARAAILQMRPNESVAHGVAQAEMLKPSEAVQPPIACRVTVANILALAEKLKSKGQLGDSLNGVQCSLVFPMDLAQLTANELVGVIVDQREVPAVLQAELSRIN